MSNDDDADGEEEKARLPRASAAAAIGERSMMRIGRMTPVVVDARGFGRRLLWLRCDSFGGVAPVAAFAGEEGARQQHHLRRPSVIVGAEA
jgi:hypothetical protein